MARKVNLYDAKTHLSELVDRACAGEEIIIAKAGRPMARLVPIGPRVAEGLIGCFKGEVEIAQDFDAPLPEELAKHFRGEI